MTSFFKDKNGLEWKLAITLDSVEQLRDSLDVDLLDSTGRVFERLADDVFLLGRTLWRLCEKQAGERSISPDEFSAAVCGDPLDGALAALTEGVANFFPSRRRLLLQRAAAAQTSIRQKAETLAMEKLADPEVENQLVEAMEKRMLADMQDILTRLRSAGS
jgi:hypothetical protein